MNEFWNLDPIYHGFEDPAFDADMQVLAQKVQELTAFAKTLEDAEPAQALHTGSRSV